LATRVNSKIAARKGRNPKVGESLNMA